MDCLITQHVVGTYSIFCSQPCVSDADESANRGLFRGIVFHNFNRIIKLLDALSRLFLVSIKLQVPAGTKELRPPNSSAAFISTPSHSQLLAEMMQSHMVKDMCLIGAKVANVSNVQNTHTAHMVKGISGLNNYYFVFSRVVASP